MPELGVPSSVDLVCSDPAHLVASFTNGQIGLFNMETRQLVLTLESTLEPGEDPLSFSFTEVLPKLPWIFWDSPLKDILGFKRLSFSVSVHHPILGSVPITRFECSLTALVCPQQALPVRSTRS